MQFYKLILIEGKKQKWIIRKEDREGKKWEGLVRKRKENLIIENILV
jgi:hypothetical protein